MSWFCPVNIVLILNRQAAQLLQNWNKTVCLLVMRSTWRGCEAQKKDTRHYPMRAYMNRYCWITVSTTLSYYIHSLRDFWEHPNIWHRLLLPNVYSRIRRLHRQAHLARINIDRCHSYLYFLAFWKLILNRFNEAISNLGDVHKACQDNESILPKRIIHSVTQRKRHTSQLNSFSCNSSSKLRTVFSQPIQSLHSLKYSRTPYFQELWGSNKTNGGLAPWWFL